MSKRMTVAVDFDGVLHAYDSPWVNAHTIPDPPVPGAIDWLHATVQHFEVVIYSNRCKTWRGRRAIRAWLKKHAEDLWDENVERHGGARGISDVKLSFEKPTALLYLDDRAWRFDGEHWPSPSFIREARPWNKRGKS